MSKEKEYTSSRRTRSQETNMNSLRRIIHGLASLALAISAHNARAYWVGLDVTASSSGQSVSYSVYDPIRGRTASGSGYGGQTLINTDRIVAWTSEDEYVWFATYDLADGSWHVGSAGWTGSCSLVNSGGVVAWSDQLAGYCEVYDPRYRTWQGGQVIWYSPCLVNPVRTQGGVVAWSDGLGEYMKFAIYDPRSSQWAYGGGSYSYSVTFSVQNSTVYWQTGLDYYTSGFDPDTDSWYGGPTHPLAYFAATPSSGNPPLTVMFLDMSIGAASWSWAFGDGTTSTARTTYHTYTSNTLFTARQVVTGTGGTVSTNTTTITTDFLTITSTSPLPAGIVGSAYGAALVASGGVEPYVWSSVSGALPSGLSLSAGGVISGTPSVATNKSFTVRVTDHSGVTATTGFVLTIVKPGGPPPPPTANAATGVISSGFTANWSSAAGATGYRLDVATDDTFSSYASGYQNLDVGAVLSRNVSGLNTNTTYYYRVRAYNSIGTSDNSGTIGVTTPDIAPPQPPGCYEPTEVTARGFTLRWGLSTGATGFLLELSTRDNFSSYVSGYQYLDVGNVQSWTFTGLSPSTIYYYRVSAYNSGGIGYAAGYFEVETAGAPPPAPIANTASRVSPGGFMANWNSAERATGYRLDVSTDSTFTNYASGYQDLDASDVLSWNVRGLNANTIYYYQVRAYNSIGPSDNSGTMSVTTQAPVILSIRLNGGSILLWWPTNTWEFTLNYCSNLLSTNWTAAAPLPVIVDGQCTVTDTLSDVMRFYRLCPLLVSDWSTLTNWTQTSAPGEAWTSIACSADGSKLAAVSGGGIYTSTNSGANWIQTSAPTEAWHSIASSADGMKLAAVVNGGGIYTSTNSGVKWTRTSAPTTGIWYSIACSADGTRLAAVVDGGGIYASTNSGAKWTKTGAPTEYWYSIACSADGTKLAAVVDGGGIYTSTNSGVQWTRTSAQSNLWFSIASSADGTKLAAGSHAAGIYISTNSGVNWTQTSAPTSGNWYSIASSADGTKLAAVMNSGGIYTSTNSGVNWTQTSAPAGRWYSIASSADGTKLAAAYYGGGLWTAQAMLVQATTTP